MPVGAAPRKLWALSDLHLGHAANRSGLEAMGTYPDDWLILAGDTGETESHLEYALDLLQPRFARVIWVPGNHELYTLPGDEGGPRGEDGYRRFVELCRGRNVITPEDPYPHWPEADPTHVIVPLFLLYDYSFAPNGMAPEEAVAWAADHGVGCTDEILLHPDPYPTRQAWCAERVRYSRERIEALPPNLRMVLINHFPLRRDLVRLYRIPRFIPWCGTTATEDWHVRYPVDVVVSGHLHMRATDWRDKVRFEEVSLGYPKNWRANKGVDHYLREILPGPTRPPLINLGPRWHR